MAENEKSAIISTFYQCDRGHKGFVSKEDFKVACVALLGYKPSKIEVEKLFAQQRLENEDEHNNSGLSLEAFSSIMAVKMHSNYNEDEEIRQMFITLDSECRGFLTLDDMRKATALVAPRLSSHVVEAAFREIDRDGDGKLTYRDFEFLMKFSIDKHS